ncbi:MAG: hypothetical protein SGI91_24130 [Alphaproteobacteria bacterium]|nr:hypothetical protein [Alphaproteobacteria bacterium]
MDTTMLWPIVVFVIKLMVVGATALMIAMNLWMLDHALRHGAVFEANPGRIRTRAQTPLRYWLYIASNVLFVAASAVMIHVFIQLGEPRGQPATNTREEQRSPSAPVPANDESYDRADADVSRAPSATTSQRLPITP